MTKNISLGWYEWPGDNRPPFEQDFVFLYRSIPVLVKTKTGVIYYGYLETTDEEEYEWKQFGRDGYIIENVIAWAYATPTRTNH